MTAPGIGPTAGASSRASYDLPVPDKPPDCNKLRRSRPDRKPREIEIGPRRVGDVSLFRRLRPLHSRHSDLGADRGPQGKKERQRRQRIEILGAARLAR